MFIRMALIESSTQKGPLFFGLEVSFFIKLFQILLFLLFIFNLFFWIYKSVSFFLKISKRAYYYVNPILYNQKNILKR